MDDLGHKQIGGTTARVGDCYIWAAIAYLDSTTDYREFFPARRVLRHDGSKDFVLLDEEGAPAWRTLLGVIAIICCVAALILVRYWD